ncbi:hypothetical protein F4553_006654 [Allocatelliglobosispora scoriae]|uniref:Uncharacterized protein n=1 Tax=Allocatelliglobosispora scoriae TaxID=643052 RepID=A0A841C2M7_9ACTN|nr:hypothetical protein [Allocatelliglobosispora scoriae]MBB5873220.1 hypothetical protein [Allocatelliglobosispora scoriae]
MSSRAAPLVTAIVIGLVGTVGATIRPASGAQEHIAVADNRADYVIIAGAPGLRWEDVSPEATPTLWRLAEHGSIGSMSVRSARDTTCPADGWLTLGAGNYAARSSETVVERCPPMDVTITRPDKIGAVLPDQRLIVDQARRDRWGAVPGALSESVRCTVAVGPGGAIAAARQTKLTVEGVPTFGRVDRYVPRLPADSAEGAELLSSCVLSIVDLGTVDAEPDPAHPAVTPEQVAAARAAQVKAVDANLAALLAARPAKSAIVVAGLADTSVDRRLHVAVIDGPGWDGGWLTSSETGRDGYVQLIDVAPTVLDVLRKTAPAKLLRGSSIVAAAGRPDDLAVGVEVPTDADREARAQRSVGAWFFGILAGLQLLIFAVVGFLMRRAYVHAGMPRPAVPHSWWRWGEVALVAAALAIPVALASDAIPWWRTGQPGWVFALMVGAGTALATFIVCRVPIYRRTLGPAGLIGALAALVVGVDLLTGATLQLNGVAGYSALEGGRYSGLGTVGLGVFIAGVLLAAGCLAQIVARRWRLPLVAAIGGLGVVAVGSPYLGADAGGAVALTAGVCITAAICTGGWLTFSRLAWGVVTGLAVTGLFALLDLRRAEADRGSLGRFLTQISDGTGGLTVNRLGVSNVVAFATSPLTLLAIGAAVFVWSALLRPWGGLKRLFGVYPAVRASVAGIAVATVIAGLLGGAALIVAGSAAATCVPLLALGALRVREHAEDRTPGAPETTDAPVLAGVTVSGDEAASDSDMQHPRQIRDVS